MYRLVALLLSCSLPAAQMNVLVVDDDPGPGVDFTNLQTALDAATSSDLLLVKDGTYPAPAVSALPDRFGISGTRRIVAEEGAGVTLTGGLRISSIDAGESVLLRGLTFDLSGLTDDGNALLVTGNAGPVWVEDCVLRSPPSGTIIEDTAGSGLTLHVAAGASVFATDLTIEGGGLVYQPLAFLQGIPIVVEGASELHLYGSTVATGQVFLTTVAPPGASLDDAFLLAAGCSLKGVQGHDEYEDVFGHTCGTDGGPALRLEAGGSPSALLYDTELLGGDPGLDTVYRTAQVGPPSQVDGGTLTEVAGSARRTAAPATITAGDTVTLSLSGETGDLVLLLVSTSFAPVHVPAFHGSLAPALPAVLFVPSAVPASGTLDVRFKAPSPAQGTEALTLFVQSLFFDGRDPVLSNGTAVTSLAPGL